MKQYDGPDDLDRPGSLGRAGDLSGRVEPEPVRRVESEPVRRVEPDLGRRVDADLSEDDETREIRVGIEHTRTEMSSTIGAIEEKLNPEVLTGQAKTVVEDVTEKAIHDAKEAAMEATQHAVEQVKEAALELTDHAVHETKDAAWDATVGRAERAVGTTVEMAGDAASTASQTARGVGATMIEMIRQNPIPAALAGLSIGYLFMNRPKGGASLMSTSGPQAVPSSYAPSAARMSPTFQPVGQTTSGGSQSTVYAPPAARTTPTSEPVSSGGWESQSTGGGLVGKVGDSAGQAGEKVGQTVSSTTEKAGDLATTATDKAGQAVSTVTDKAGDIASAAGEKAGQAASTAGYVAGTAGDVVGGVGQIAALLAGGVVGTVAQTAKQTGVGIFQAARANPLPAALTGTGLVWLYLNSPSGPSASTTTYGPEGRGTTGSMADTVGDTASQAGDKAAEITDQAQQKAGEIADRATTRAQQLQGRVGQMVTQNPMMAGALAATVGSAIGLALPPTPREDQLLGKARDSVMGQAREMSQDTMQKVERVAESAKEGAKSQGLTV